MEKQFRKRNAILTYLRSTTAHPSAETVFADLKPQIPDLSMGTVYRNLKLFRRKGLVSSVATIRGVERFDADTKPHIHFICTCCDAVIDLDMPELSQELLNTAQGSTAAEVQNVQVLFEGICSTCRKGKKGV